MSSLAAETQMTTRTSPIRRVVKTNASSTLPLCFSTIRPWAIAADKPPATAAKRTQGPARDQEELVDKQPKLNLIQAIPGVLQSAAYDLPLSIPKRMFPCCLICLLRGLSTHSERFGDQVHIGSVPVDVVPHGATQSPISWATGAV